MAPLLRLLAAALLLAGMPEVSKIICISSTGHEAVEDWAAACCLPGADHHASSVSQRGSCEGCRDFSLLPAVAIMSGHDPSSVGPAGMSVCALAAPAPWTVAATPTSPIPVAHGADSNGSTPSTTTLRC